jgi:hypothetical protein
VRALALLLLFGATVGSLLDAMHTFGGATQYTHPFVLQTAWWVPLLFASAYGFGGFIYAVGYDKLRGRGPLRSWSELALGLVVFAALYAISAFAPLSNVCKMIALAAGAVGLWAWLDRTVVGVFLTCVAGLFGPVTEVLLSHAELFRHLRPDFLGIPVWLPALYLATGPSFGQFARRVRATDTLIR